MLYDRQIIGYHGCHVETAERLLAGEPFRPSTEDYDWLGTGVYFWEFGPNRAYRWAEERYGDNHAVVGAVIQLGTCFDLLDARATADLREAARIFTQLPDMTSLKNRGTGRKARFFDCALINWYLSTLASSAQTVRCGFVEGEPVYDDGHRHTELFMETHVQVAVRNPDCIVGVFRPAPQSSEER